VRGGLLLLLDLARDGERLRGRPRELPCLLAGLFLGDAEIGRDRLRDRLGPEPDPAHHAHPVAHRDEGRGRRVADDAAGAAGVRRGHDRGQKADMHFFIEYGMRYRAADDGRGNIVEKGRHHEYQQQQRCGTGPVVGENRGQQAGDVTFFEMIRKQCKADQQPEQVGKDDPFVGEVSE